jgi:hypothetical protein
VVIGLRSVPPRSPSPSRPSARPSRPIRPRRRGRPCGSV